MIVASLAPPAHRGCSGAQRKAHFNCLCIDMNMLPSDTHLQMACAPCCCTTLWMLQLLLHHVMDVLCVAAPQYGRLICAAKQP
jgi:hypothetical protein